MSIKSSLGKIQPMSPMSDEELFAKKHEGWNEHKILVVLPEQKSQLKNKHIEAINEIGNLLYGGKLNGKQK